MGSGWLKEGMMVMGSSPARKLEAARERAGVRGVLPKNVVEAEPPGVVPVLLVDDMVFALRFVSFLWVVLSFFSKHKIELFFVGDQIDLSP